MEVESTEWISEREENFGRLHNGGVHSELDEKLPDVLADKLLPFSQPF